MSVTHLPSSIPTAAATATAPAAPAAASSPLTSSTHAAHARAAHSTSHPSLTLQPDHHAGGLVFSNEPSPAASPRASSSRLPAPPATAAPPLSSPSPSPSPSLRPPPPPTDDADKSTPPQRTALPHAPSSSSTTSSLAPPQATSSPASRSRTTRNSRRQQRDPRLQPIPDYVYNANTLGNSSSSGSGSGGGSSSGSGATTAANAWGVALHPPSPHAAPAFTISYRSSPDPSQFPSFQSLLRSMPRKSLSASTTLASTTAPTQPAASVGDGGGSSTSTSTGGTANTAKEATPAPSLISTHPSSPSTADAPDLAASLVTEATSIADVDGQPKVETPATAAAASSASTPPAPSSPAPKKPAWGAPKSWAELASRGTPASARQGAVGVGVGVGVSVNFGDAAPPAATEVAGGAAVPPRSPSRGASASRRKSGGGGGAGAGAASASTTSRPAVMSLERLLADSHRAFNAPLTHPRGLVNTGNFCFANAILQMLVYCAPFYNLFTLIGREVPADFGNATPLMEAVIHFLREFTLVDQQNGANGTVGGGDGGGKEAVVVSSFAPGASEPFVPEFVYDAMRLNKRFDQMRRGHQEDAEEFLGFFLDTLHEELLAAIRRSAVKLAQTGSGAHSLLAKMSEEERRLNGVTDADLKRLGVKVNAGRGDANGAAVHASALGLGGLGGGDDDDAEEIEEREVTRPVSPSDEGWMEVGQKGKTAFTRTTSTSDSPITRIFGGKLRSVLKCPGAKDSVTLEPYQPLQLDIQPAHVQSIEDALVNLTAPELIPGVYSPAKGTHIDATKQVFIESLPPVLIVHLKRFVYDEVGGVQKSQKPLAYGTTLEIAGEALSPARRAQGRPRYKLFGVVYHHGRFASGGHYTVDVLRQDNRSWLHIDDTTFSTIPSEHVVRTAGKSTAAAVGHDGLAYLLFYKREDVDGEGAGAGSSASASASAFASSASAVSAAAAAVDGTGTGTGTATARRNATTPFGRVAASSSSFVEQPSTPTPASAVAVAGGGGGGRKKRENKTFSPSVPLHSLSADGGTVGAGGAGGAAGGAGAEKKEKRSVPGWKR